jgi:NADH dehydrogenase
MGGVSFEQAVRNSCVLFAAAKAAGVSRVVHVSITNPSEGSPFEYFRGKARVERALIESGLSYAILRPAVVFGDEGILINNIAWALRQMPAFGLFGNGAYRLQPIFAGDLAALAIDLARRSDNVIVDAIGPETFTYRHLVETIAATIQVRRPIIALPPLLAWAMAWPVGKLLGDEIVTRDEMRSLMAELLCTDSSPTGATKLTEWLSTNATRLGRHYMSELARRRQGR